MNSDAQTHDPVQTTFKASENTSQLNEFGNTLTEQDRGVSLR